MGQKVGTRQFYVSCVSRCVATKTRFDEARQTCHQIGLASYPIWGFTIPTTAFIHLSQLYTHYTMRSTIILSIVLTTFAALTVASPLPIAGLVTADTLVNREAQPEDVILEGRRCIPQNC